MEFVIVTCDGEQRTVFIDNQEQGSTDQRLSVPEGLHVFDLGAPVDYTPPFQELLVEGTTHTDPMPVAFTPLETRETVPAPKRARKRKGARKAAGPRKGRKATGRKKTAGRKKKAAKTARRRKTASRKKR